MVAATSRNALESFGTASKGKGSAEDLIRQAGGGFSLRKVSLANWSGKPCLPGQHIVVREDTETAVGMVGESYETFDNLQFFPPIANELVSATGAKIDRFSMLDGGARAIMRLSWGDTIRIGSAKVGDVVARRAIITTSHDSKWAGKLILEALRLACENGMTVPCGQSEFALTHSKGGHHQLADIVNLIPRISDYFRNFTTAATIMSQTPILSTSSRCQTIISKIVDPQNLSASTKSGDDNAAKARVNRITELFAGSQAGGDNRAVKGTAWGLFNAASDYYNHKKTKGENEREQRFRSLLPGRNGGPAAKDIVRAWGIVNDELKITKAIEAAIANN